MRDVGRWDGELRHNELRERERRDSAPRRRKVVMPMKPENDGLLLVVLFVLIGLGAWAHVVPAEKAGTWGDMILGGVLLWIRSSHGRNTEPQEPDSGSGQTGKTGQEPGKGEG